MIRKSNYNIISKLDEKRYVIMHGYTSAIDIINTSVKNYINENCTHDEKLNNYLLNRGYFTTETSDEEIKRVLITGKKISEIYEKQGNYSSIVIMVTYDCNFRCPYCYEKQVRTIGDEKLLKLVIDSKKIDKIYELLNDEKLSFLNNKLIYLYGGEPFLSKNYNTVKYIIEKGHKLGYIFSATTNGYEIESYSKYLTPDYINTLQIPLDGGEDYHNKSRYHYKNGKTFKKIIFNINNILKSGVKISLRLNIDKNNINSLKQIVSIFNENKWFDKNNLSLYLANINNGGEQIDPNDNLNLFESFGEMKNYILRANDNLIYDKFMSSPHPVKDNIKNVMSSSKIFPFTHHSCGAHKNMFVFDPIGNIYPCWEFVGKKEHMIGKFFPEFKLFTEQYKLWQNRTIENLPICKKCKYALICSGGCAAHAYNKNGTIYSNYCEDFDKTMKTLLRDAFYEINNKNIAALKIDEEGALYRKEVANE